VRERDFKLAELYAARILPGARPLASSCFRVGAAAWSLAVFRKPFNDGRHISLKAAGNEKVQHSGPCVRLIFKIVQGVGGYPDERTFFRIDPLVLYQNRNRLMVLLYPNR